MCSDHKFLSQSPESSAVLGRPVGPALRSTGTAGSASHGGGNEPAPSQAPTCQPGSAKGARSALDFRPASPPRFTASNTPVLFFCPYHHHLLRHSGRSAGHRSPLFGTDLETGPSKRPKTALLPRAQAARPRSAPPSPCWMPWAGHLLAHSQCGRHQGDWSLRPSLPPKFLPPAQVTSSPLPSHRLSIWACREGGP
jgi:hypothetical protein